MITKKCPAIIEVMRADLALSNGDGPAHALPHGWAVTAWLSPERPIPKAWKSAGWKSDRVYLMATYPTRTIAQGHARRLRASIRAGTIPALGMSESKRLRQTYHRRCRGRNWLPISEAYEHLRAALSQLSQARRDPQADPDLDQIAAKTEQAMNGAAAAWGRRISVKGST